MKPDFTRGTQETKDGVQLSICRTPRKRSINLSRKCGLTREIADQTSENIFFFFCAEKENLCLYGLPNETWEVNLPAEEVPPELPEPALGINFARDGMNEKDWLSLVAVHSDSWLLSVAFYFGARFSFDKESRYFICSYYKNSVSVNVFDLFHVHRLWLISLSIS